MTDFKNLSCLVRVTVCACWKALVILWSAALVVCMWPHSDLWRKIWICHPFPDHLQSSQGIKSIFFSKQIFQKDVSCHQILQAQLTPVYLKCLGKKATHGESCCFPDHQAHSLWPAQHENVALSLMPLPLCKAGKGEPSHANASTTCSPLCLLETVADNKKKLDH